MMLIDRIWEFVKDILKLVGLMMFWVIVTFFPLATIMTVLEGNPWHDVFAEDLGMNDGEAGIFVMLAFAFGMAAGIMLWELYPIVCPRPGSTKAQKVYGGKE